jgi:integrase
LAIDLDTAFRRANAIKLKLQQHLGSVDKPTGRMLVEIPPHETKSEGRYVSERRPRAVGLLQEYVSRWRPLIAAGNPEYLFPIPGLGDAARERVALTSLAGRLGRLVRCRLGIDFNLHNLRSLLATLYAEANPGDIKTAQIKLGHRSDRSTQKWYIDPNQRQANRRFDAVIEAMIDPISRSSVNRPERKWP